MPAADRMAEGRSVGLCGIGPARKKRTGNAHAAVRAATQRAGKGEARRGRGPEAPGRTDAFRACRFVRCGLLERPATGVRCLNTGILG
jgi:hypothetical protein